MPDQMDASANEQDPARDDPRSADAPTNNSSPTDEVGTDAPMAAHDAAATERSTESVSPDDGRGAVFEEFCEAVRSCGAPNLLTRNWGFLNRQNTLVRIDMPPSEFVAALEQDYAVEKLIAFGFYERVAGELRLPSWLQGDAPVYVNLDEEDTIRFSRGNEFLFPMIRTAFEQALERTPPDSVEAPGTLFIVDSQDSVEVMQRLGLPAVSSEGLEDLCSQHIQKLFDGDQRTDFGWRYHLFLLDCDVAQLDIRPTAAIGHVIQRLGDAQDVYGIDPARRFCVCRPSAHEFQRLERAISFEDCCQISTLFETWAAAARSVRINNWRTHFVTETASFSVARAALARALELADVARRFAVSTALPVYRAACHIAVTEKFYQAIGRGSNPFDEIDLMSAAEYAETFVELDPLIRAGEAVMAGRCPPKVYEFQDELFEKRQSCMVELRRMSRDRKTKR